MRRDKKLRDLVPGNPNRPYDMKELVAAVVDEGYFYEVQREFAPNILAGLARLGGVRWESSPINLRIWQDVSISMLPSKPRDSFAFAIVSTYRS